MKNLLDRIFESQLAKRFYDAPTPRSIALLSDIMVVSVCSLLAFVLPTESFLAKHSMLPLAYLLFIAVYTLVDILLGFYRGVVRISLTNSAFNTFKYVLTSTLILVAISWGYMWISRGDRLLISPLTIVLIGAIIMCIMLMIRILVKYTFIHIGGHSLKREPVLIFGSAINSLSLASSMSREVHGDYAPKALISFKKDIKYRTVNGIPIEIYNPDTIHETFEKYNSSTLIILNEHAELIRGEIAENLINNGIRILLLNQIEELDLNADNQPNISGHVSKMKIEDLLGRSEINIDFSMIHRQIDGSTVLITGAAGSIGSEIVRQVASFGVGKIILLDQAETPMHDMQLLMEELYPDVQIELHVGDVRNKQRLRNIFELYHPQYIYHAAAYKHVPMMERNAPEAILTNVMGTKNLADLAVEYGVKKFVMVSTDKAVNPTNIMGASKRIAEIYVQSLHFYAMGQGSGTEFITTRFGNVLGSNGSVIPLFRSQIEKGGPITVTHHDITRYFMTIPEACKLVLEAGCIGHGGEIYIFDMGKPMKIYDLATRMIKLAGLRPNIDIKIVETGLRPGEKLYEELLNDKETTLPSNVNDKIMIAKVRKYRYQEITPLINRMIESAESSNIHDMVMQMKELVPEYISKNSAFETIDAEMHRN